MCGILLCTIVTSKHGAVCYFSRKYDTPIQKNYNFVKTKKHNVMKKNICEADTISKLQGNNTVFGEVDGSLRRAPIASITEDCVKLTGDQTITGVKTFDGGGGI